jgi:shikimate dehydrogenase
MIKHHLLVINTTPLGMYPQIENSPQFPYEFLTPDHFCIDLVYNPEETLFLKKAKQNGAKTMNGLSMLYLQADKAWEIWSNG